MAFLVVGGVTVDVASYRYKSIPVGDGAPMFDGSYRTTKDFYWRSCRPLTPRQLRLLARRRAQGLPPSVAMQRRMDARLLGDIWGRPLYMERANLLRASRSARSLRWRGRPCS